MAVLEKIEDLTWFNLVEKLKRVLIEILENIENIWSRVKTLENEDANLPVYADNAAAVSGGLAVNKKYKTATGELRIVI